MASDRIQRQIDRLLDEADQAISRYDWGALREAAQAVLRFDPENTDALAYLAAAERDSGNTQPSHGLGLTLDAAAAGFVQPLGLDQGEGHFPVQQGVVGQVDLLFPALAQELLDLVAAVGEGRGLKGSRRSGNGWNWCGSTDGSRC